MPCCEEEKEEPKGGLEKDSPATAQGRWAHAGSEERLRGAWDGVQKQTFFLRGVNRREGGDLVKKTVRERKNTLSAIRLFTFKGDSRKGEGVEEKKEVLRNQSPEYELVSPYLQKKGRQTRTAFNEHLSSQK